MYCACGMDKPPFVIDLEQRVKSLEFLLELERERNERLRKFALAYTQAVGNYVSIEENDQ